MSRIFISYRRSDGTKDASRLAEDLGAIFGPEQVFFDQYDMQGGRSWREQILAAMDEPPVVALLVITPNYFGEQRNGQLRILGEDDAVRLELRHAMQVRAHLLPALTDHVSMPARAALPEELQGLPELHAPPLRSRDWRKTDLP
ncbi:MAG: toll/interleukin-1 receptor domain-containing protein, partial [Leptothrix sp. (in: b-proteobacteria)]